MNEDRIKGAYDSMTPDEAARQRMLKRIMNKGEYDMKKEYSAQPQETKGWLGPVAAILVLACLIAGTITMLNRDEPSQLSNDQTGETAESTESLQTGAIADFMESNFYKASVEWYDYLQTNSEEASGNVYVPYGSYQAVNEESATKLDQILANYGLTMYDGDDMGTDSYDYFLEAVELESFLRQDVEGVVWDIDSCWWYDQQRFNVAGSVTMNWQESHRTVPVDFNFYRTTPDYLLPAFVEMGHLENYEWWQRTLFTGEPMILAIGAESSYVIVIRAEEIYFIVVDNWRQSETDRRMDKASLNDFADLFDFIPVERIESQEADADQETDPNIAAFPLQPIIDDNCTAAVSLSPGGVYEDAAGEVFMDVILYIYDLYDMVDIAQLEVGDNIYIRGQVVEITSLERNDAGTVLINGGPSAGGYALCTDESTVYYEIDANGAHCWQEWADMTYPVSSDFEFRDITEKCMEIHKVSYFLEICDDCVFSPDDTTIVIEDGLIIALERVCASESTTHHEEQHHGH